MKQTQKEKIEYRYYEVPQDFPVIALTGEKWEGIYGTDPMHFHNFLEIGICRYGKGIMQLGKEEIPYRDGTITVIPRNQPHRTKVEPENQAQKWEYLFVDAERMIREAYTDKTRHAEQLIKRLNARMFLAHAQDQPDMLAAIDMIFRGIEQKKSLHKEMVKHMLLALLLKIITLNEHIRDKVEHPEKSEENYEGIVRVLNYISQNYASDLKISDMAELSNMSETYFRRVFEEYMHTSPVKYLSLVRVEKAWDLIRKGNGRLEEVGEKAGFPVHATFLRNFKSITGYTPREWRAMARNKDDLLIEFKVEVLKGWNSAPQLGTGHF